MTSPLVSIIVPCYQHAAYLDERMRSIFAQTYTNYEVILLDDASSDGSAEILVEYAKDPRVNTLVVNEANSGSACAQWRKGVGLARGELIWIAESDDTCAPEFLSRLVPLLTADVALAYCRSQRVDEQGRPMNSWFWPDGLDPLLWKRDHQRSGLEALRHAMVYRNVVPNASSCVFRRQAAHFNDVIMRMRYAGDWIFWSDILSRGGMAYLAGTFNSFRQHPASTRTGTDRSGELQRLWEYSMAIDHAQRLSGIRIGYDNWRKYSWIFHEVKAKSEGIFDALRMLQSFPPSFRRFYLWWSLIGKVERVLKGN